MGKNQSPFIKNLILKIYLITNLESRLPFEEYNWFLKRKEKKLFFSAIDISCFLNNDDKSMMMI